MLLHCVPQTLNPKLSYQTHAISLVVPYSGHAYTCTVSTAFAEHVHAHYIIEIKKTLLLMRVLPHETLNPKQPGHAQAVP